MPIEEKYLKDGPALCKLNYIMPEVEGDVLVVKPQK